ncbi:MAG: LD-carboxypeptidase [Flavobacteriales bacterium]
MNLIAPPTLQKGDLVYLCAPAKAIEENYVVAAEKWLASIGLRALRSKHLTGRSAYFSGTELQRLADLQEGLDHPEAKAIWCVRGGYGSVQLVDGLQWAAFIRAPKWVVGFSDICVLHHKVQALGIQSIHGTMALNIEKNSDFAKNRLQELLFGEKRNFAFAAHPQNKLGTSSGKLIGGNLSIIYSLLASAERYDFSGAILFIEDLAEHLYHIDRMLHALRKCGALDQIEGLIVGGMTDLEDTDVPFGKSLEELILAHFTFRKIPICFGFPAGHIEDNQALNLGAKVNLNILENQCLLNYL